MASDLQPPLILADGLLVDPVAGHETFGDVRIEDGVVVGVGRNLPREEAVVIDCRGLVVAPGLVDIRAFIGEPGAEHRETLATASRAAAAGGVTTVVCMPTTHPPIDDPAIVDFVQRRARDTAIVHIGVMAAMTKGLAGEEMSEIGLLLEAGALAFTDGSKSVMNARLMRQLMVYAHDFDALLVHHTEDATLVGAGVMNEGEFASRLGLPGIPTAAEAVMLERDMRLVRLTGARYHAASVTCADSIEILRRAKDAGLPVTASVSINHLTLNENDIGAFRTFCKVSPPLRAESDRRALVEAVADGTIDTIVSDHNPQDVETKRLPFNESADGAIGLETMLPAAMRLVHAGDLSLATLLRALARRPAELLGLDAGRLSAGAPADIVVFDPDAPFVLDPATLRSRCKNTPFDGARLQGEVRLTLVDGRIVFRSDDRN